MELTRGSGVALWRQIQQTLEGEIARGVLPTGQKLPTEQALAARFGVNRHTVRRAMAALIAKGLVRSEQGRGAFVQEPVIDYSLTKRVRFSQNLMRQRRLPGGQQLGGEVVEAEGSVAKNLRLVPGTPVLRLDSTGEADGRVIGVFSHYFPATRFPDLERHVRETGSITAGLKLSGVPDYTRKWTRITARAPSQGDAKLLGQPRGKPILVTESLNVDPADEPVEYGLARWASDAVQLIIAEEGLDHDPHRANS